MSLSRTLESLEEYIDAQREIIERAHIDIQSLLALKREAANDPQTFVENLPDKLSNASLLQNDLEPFGPEYIDWDLLKGADPSILHQIPIPSLKFRRSSVIDDPAVTTDVQNQVHKLIRDFRPRIEHALSSASCEDESQSGEASTPIPDPQARIREQPKRKRRREASDDEECITSSLQPPARKASPYASPATDPMEPSASSTAAKGRKPKERPALFKVPWTLQEQHLLEKCLLEIPETEKHRWVKISEAMGGVRTARQVASRVQKYNEKLKKFGLQ